MRGVDTNVLARFFVNDPDDPDATRQRGPATAVMSGSVFVSVTVLLELEWVLRGFYELARADVRRVLSALCALPSATIEDRDAVLTALDWHARGVDFADALHLARSGRHGAFVSFDRKLARRATRLAGAPRVEVPR
ncbi:MAG: type II toxin-antitoxin system VapC family toxin [Myxococcales bacterium]|nr:type II toxin-antitoxin system VapC family toxin [Myxococcales bacterium]